MKNFTNKIDLLTNEEYLEVYIRGRQILNDPFLNKASAFTQEERMSLNLEGFLRYECSTLEVQSERAYEAFQKKTTDIEKYIYLQGLLNRNETLFYKLILDHMHEMLPIVYTPTVGKACMTMSHIVRRYRGIYINRENISAIDRIFQNIEQPEISLIVVTDGERILGLGDLGSDGMGIPIGKVNLYVAAGGFYPSTTLPISLDVGTNNERLLNDEMYLGQKQKRLEGEEYYAFIEKFVLGIKRNFPNALLQWEDFAQHKAFNLLEGYRDRILSFNDDIQGTGAVALSAMLTAMKIKNSDFKSQRFAIVGLGQAGSGIAFNIKAMLKEEGLTEEEANDLIYPIEHFGLITDDMEGIAPRMMTLAKNRSQLQGWKLDNENKISMKDVIRNAKPTVLIGVTAQTGLFDTEVIQMMAENTDRPIIFALSNPTSKSECKPEDVIEITKGKALMAFGSLIPEITSQYGTFHISQCNNLYIFPGVGLGALISKTPRINFRMFLNASKELSSMVTAEQRALGYLLPPLDDIRHVSYRVARSVAIEARDSGMGRILTDQQLEKLIKRAQWVPTYLPYRPGYVRDNLSETRTW
jgi:malate dehydrogenase (oxaloacetate-decarboxylating)